MKKNINENPSLAFLNALIEIGKQFDNQLKEYSNNNLFGELFPDMKKEFNNSIKELDEFMKNVNKTKENCEKIREDLKELNHAHIETTETEDSYSYLLRDDSPKTHDEIIELLKEKLNDFTFAACSENDKKYKLKFIFNNSIHYGFKWDKNVMHFLGETNDPDFVFADEDFYFDETKNDFFVCEFDKKECDVKELPAEEEVTDEQGPSSCDEVCLEGDQNDHPCECDGNVTFTADTLFEKVNKEVDESVETDLLPIIKTGVDRIFNYKLYTIDRTGNVPGFDIVVFTLEDAKLNCEQYVPEFWEIVPYTRLVRFLVDTYHFPKVFILDKNTKDGYVHEVRCHLK